MCECIVQHACPENLLGLLAHNSMHKACADRHAFNHSLNAAATFALASARNVIKPGMPVSAIRQRHGQLECVKVRWGWSPIWTMGTLPPRTHLPMSLVMRSRVFDPVWREGRVLVAVDGWYDTPVESTSPQSRRLSYTTSRQSSPIFLAALAQVSDKPSGCNGLALLTCDDQQRLLAFGAEDAQAWLQPDLPWQQAQEMAAHVAVDEPQLEHVLTAQRLFQGKR